MINFGCTRAPYYAPDPRCRARRGFHHGRDMAMPCGTRLFAGLRGRVVRPGSSGSLGSAYGAKAFRIRNQHHDVDIVIGHVQRVYVAAGDLVRRGQLIARAGAEAARPKGQGHRAAIRPGPYLRLRR
jgi:murein DD-endopeptidase MepM/ murein hydrolase activator NlpD